MCDAYPMIELPQGVRLNIQYVDSVLKQIEQDVAKVFFKGRKVRVFLSSSQKSPTDAVVTGVRLSIIGADKLHVEVICKCKTAQAVTKFISLRYIREDTRT